MRNPVMLFMVAAIIFTGLAGICTSLAALFHHPPTADTPAAAAPAMVPGDAPAALAPAHLPAAAADLPPGPASLPKPAGPH